VNNLFDMGAGAKGQNLALDAAQRRQAMEGQMMRRRALEQQEQSAAGQEQVTPFETSAPQPGFGLEAMPQPGYGLEAAPMGRTPQPRGTMRSGIAFGPGRSTRLPEQGSPEYEQLLQRVRGLGQMK
jgi:hypothetical protein